MAFTNHNNNQFKFLKQLLLISSIATMTDAIQIRKDPLQSVLSNLSPLTPPPLTTTKIEPSLPLLRNNFALNRKDETIFSSCGENPCTLHLVTSIRGGEENTMDNVEVDVDLSEREKHEAILLEDRDNNDDEEEVGSSNDQSNKNQIEENVIINHNDTDDKQTSRPPQTNDEYNDNEDTQDDEDSSTTTEQTDHEMMLDSEESTSTTLLPSISETINTKQNEASNLRLQGKQFHDDGDFQTAAETFEKADLELNFAISIHQKKFEQFQDDNSESNDDDVKIRSVDDEFDREEFLVPHSDLIKLTEERATCRLHETGFLFV